MLVKYRCCAYPFKPPERLYPNNAESMYLTITQFFEYRVYGYVLSKATGMPVAEAHVVLPSSRYVMTDQNGMYSIILAPGKHMLQARTYQGSYSLPLTSVELSDKIRVKLVNITLNRRDKDMAFALPSFWNPDATIDQGEQLPSDGCKPCLQTILVAIKLILTWFVNATS